MDKGEQSQQRNAPSEDVMRVATYTPTVYTPAWNLNAVRNVALFVAAPFIALAYVVLFPFVGLATLAWMALHN
jgi:hypothetical protein